MRKGEERNNKNHCCQFFALLTSINISDIEAKPLQDKHTIKASCPNNEHHFQLVSSSEIWHKNECTQCGMIIGGGEHIFVNDGEVILGDCSNNATQSQKCKECGHQKVIELPETTDPLKHEYVWVTVQEATCRVEGLKVEQCKRCQDVLITQIIEKTDHHFKVVEHNEATCTSKGLARLKCLECQEAQVEYSSALRHNFNEWQIIKEATVDYEGEERRICITCGYEEIKNIEKEERVNRSKM